MSGNHEAVAIKLGLDIPLDSANTIKTFVCKICLWTFETETELGIHNYLEHLIMKRDDIRNNYKDE